MRPIALTMGDPAGIGGELTLRNWLTQGPVVVTLDDPDRLAALAKTLGLDVPIRVVHRAADAAAIYADALPVLPVRLAEPAVPGQPNPANAAAVVASIEQATALCLSGEASAMVTNPINKAALYQAGFHYPGHTEFLAALTGASGQQIMMLAVTASESRAGDGARVAASLDRDADDADDRRCLAHHRAGAAPGFRARGAAAGDRRAEPACRRERRSGRRGNHDHPAGDRHAPGRGDRRSGPWPPDTMFTPAARKRYDVAICMYHDQALIPLKTLDMDHGVNVTLGLPIVRTSPDHGTAYDIAGKGVADPSSLIAAIALAAELASRRVAGGGRSG